MSGAGENTGTGENKLFRGVLLAIIAASLSYSALQLTYGVFGESQNYNKDLAKDVALFIGIALIALLLRQNGGRLTKLTLPGTSAEFAPVVEKINQDTLELKRLAAEVENLKQAIGKGADRVLHGQQSVLPAPVKSPTPPYTGTTRNDQQKGRFGGKSTVGAFTLSVAFKSAYDAKVVGLDLIVSGDTSRQLVENVHFYLHETFRPDIVVVSPQNNRATLDILCVGGFTVGAWIEGTDIFLELDLALERRAPRIIKEN